MSTYREFPTALCWIVAAFFVLVPAAHAIAADDSVDEPTLFWSNGDRLPGVLVGATEDTISWRSEKFAEPLEVRLEALHAIRFPNSPGESRIRDERSQIIETRDGNRFFGRVTGSDGEWLTLRTDLFGEIGLQRSAVSMIANPVERAHVYSGPRGLRGWSTLTYGRKLDEWTEIASGRLMTRLVAAELYRQLPATGSIDLDIEFLWRNNPSFHIRFLTPYSKPTRETVKIETRVGGYVVQTLGSNGRFRQLDTMSSRTQKCRLTLRWNQNASELAVYRDRTYLGKIEVPAQDSSGPAGIYIKNTGPQLTLSRLEVRASSSLDIKMTDLDRDTVLLEDNTSLAGSVKKITAAGIQLVGGDEKAAGARELPWDRIAEVAFRQTSDGPNEGNEHRMVECVFRNGETLKGSVVGADSGRLTLGVPSIREPLPCDVEKLERIVLGKRTVPPRKGARAIVFPIDRDRGIVRRVHGELASTSNDSLAWLATGAVRPVTPSLGEQLDIEIAEPTSSVAGGPQEDLVYLRNGDVIPCRLHAAGSGGIDLGCRFGKRTRVQPSDVSAIELSSPPVAPLTGFDDRWRATEDEANESIAVTDSSLRLQGSLQVQREAILNGCDRIAFRMRRNKGSGGLFLHVGLLGDNNDEAEDKKLPFYFMDQKLFVLGSKRNAFVPCLDENQWFDVVIETRDPFRVAVNEKTVYSIPGTHNGGPWTGLSFEVSDGPLFGPAVKRKQQPIDVSIEGLHISQTRRQSIRQTTGSLDSESLLTVPRNRSPESLTHLAIGTNSDAVRGNLVELGTSELRMRSKSEEIRLPRESISGLVWLHGESFEPDPGSWRIVLKDTTSVSLQDLSLMADELVGTHPVFGKFCIPRAEVCSVHRGEVTSIHRHAFRDWQMVRAAEPKFDNTTEGHRFASEMIGKPVRFRATMLDDGQGLNLNHHLGKVVVLDFWATWCAPCIRTMPHLIEAFQQFSDDEVQLIAVNEGDDERTVRAMVRAKDWTGLQVALDPDSTASQAIEVEAIPQTVILDQDGLVTAAFVGAGRDTQAEIVAEVKRLLEKDR